MFTPQSFLFALVAQAGITNHDLQNKAVANLEPVLLDRVITSLFAELGETHQQTAYDIANTGNRYQLEQFFATNIPSYLQVLESILDEFASEYLQEM